MEKAEIVQTFRLSFTDCIWLRNVSPRPSPRTLTEGTLDFLAWISVLELAKDSSRQHFKLPSGKELCKSIGWISFEDRSGGGVTGFAGSFRCVG